MNASSLNGTVANGTLSVPVTLQTVLAKLAPHTRQLLALAKQHASILVAVGLFVVGVVFGALLRRNRLDKVMKNYHKFTTQEQHIRETQQTFLSRFSAVRRLIYLVLFMLVLFMSIVIANEPPATPYRRFIAPNVVPLAATALLILLIVLSGKFRDWRIKNIEQTLRNTLDQKSRYLDEFLGLIGRDMRADILEHEDETLAEKLEEQKAKEEERKTTAKKLAEVASEKSALESSLVELKRVSSLAPKVGAAYEDFHAKLVSFNWCEACYNPEAIRQFALELTEQKKRDEAATTPRKSEALKRKDTPKELPPAKPDAATQEPAAPAQTPGLEPAKLPVACAERCLIRYHIFCDQLEQALNQRLGEARAA